MNQTNQILQIITIILNRFWQWISQLSNWLLKTLGITPTSDAIVAMNWLLIIAGLFTLILLTKYTEKMLKIAIVLILFAFAVYILKLTIP